jgi:hypothetical protein
VFSYFHALLRGEDCWASGAELAVAIASTLGLVVALAMLPETKGKGLEAIESETGASAGEIAARQFPAIRRTSCLIAA